MNILGVDIFSEPTSKFISNFTKVPKNEMVGLNANFICLLWKFYIEKYLKKSPSKNCESILEWVLYGPPTLIKGLYKSNLLVCYLHSKYKRLQIWGPSFRESINPLVGNYLVSIKHIF